MQPNVIIALLATLGSTGSKMDLSIGGKSANAYHASVFDPEKKLYLFSAGD